MRQTVIESERKASRDDLGLGEIDERSVDAKSCTFDARLRGNSRQLFELANELWTTIRISGVIERIHTDHDVTSAEHLAPTKCKREKDRVASRYVGRWNAGFVQIAVPGHRSFRSQRRASDRSEVKIELDLKEGINQEQAKKISKLIRDEGPKGVKVQVQGEELRVSSKKRDDLQTVIALVKEQDYDFAVQFTNYR